jgi:hypothetical protein
MSQSHCCKQFIQMALMALWMSTVCVNPILAAELEVDELISSIRNHILTAEKRAKEQPLFGVKEVKLTISYAVEKKGEGGVVKILSACRLNKQSLINVLAA